MSKFDQNSLPKGTDIIAETDMVPVIAAINAADDVPDQSIQRGVCLAMSLKWVESGVRNLDFWDTLTQDETLNDIKWLQRRQTAVRQEMARAVGLSLPQSSGEFKPEGLVEAIKGRYGSGQLTEDQKQRVEQLDRKSQDWFGKAVQERTGLKLDQETSFSNRDQVEGVAWDIATGPVGYYVLGIYGKGGHAIAVHAGSDGKVHLMDPEYGELRFHTMTDFIDYFPHHLQEYERSSFGKIRKCTLSAFKVSGDMHLPDELERKRLRRAFPNVFPSELRRHGFLSERPLPKIIPEDLVEKE